jgi:ABC-type lipoprotein export system ATPase subunit
MVAPVIKLQAVGKVFLTDEVETHALSDIDLEVAKGEYVCIAGPSGCGKSTLLSILGLLDSATRAEYWLNGQAVADLSVMDLLRELHQSGATICMVTLDPRYARHAERNIHLFDGRVVAQPLEMAAS